MKKVRKGAKFIRVPADLNSDRISRTAKILIQNENAKLKLVSPKTNSFRVSIGSFQCYLTMLSLFYKSKLSLYPNWNTPTIIGSEET